MAGRVTASAPVSIALWILAALATVWFLRTGSRLLIPIALAVLISYALEPVVAWLERRHVHRVAASAAVLLAILGGIVAGGYALRHDAMRVAHALPTATERAREMVTSQLGSGADALSEATSSLGGKSPSGDREAIERPSGTSGDSAGSLVQRAVSATFAVAGHLVVICFLVFFLLISGHHVKNRLVEVMGRDADHRRMTARIIDDINVQIQRYLLVLLFTAAVVGLATWLVLASIGVEHAVTWGILAGVFNSIPYFGPVIVSGGLFVVGIVQGGDLGQALQMSGAALVITSLEGWLLTPALMGKVERMGALVVFLGLMLWTWLWGPWGTVLAVPMLVIVKSIADHVERLRPVSRLMAP